MAPLTRMQNQYTKDLKMIAVATYGSTLLTLLKHKNCGATSKVSKV